MFRIAIVDDDITIFEIIKEHLVHCLGENAFVLFDYDDGQAFSESLREGEIYDIVFMDIEMKHLDGIAAGHFLRDIDTDEDIYLVYMTSYDAKIKQLFSVHPFEFIEKPITYERINYVISRILNNISRRNERICVTVNHCKRNIIVSKIKYIESSGRKAIFHMRDGKNIEVYMKLEDIHKLLDNMSFIRPHKSYLVNQQYIDKISYSAIIVDNITISITDKYKKEILDYLSSMED